MAWIDQYKDAIEQAAWETGVPVIAADSMAIDGTEEIPTLYLLSPSKQSGYSLQKEFEESLRKLIGAEQPFMAYAASPRLVRANTEIYSFGEWRL